MKKYLLEMLILVMFSLVAQGSAPQPESEAGASAEAASDVRDEGNHYAEGSPRGRHGCHQQAAVLTAALHARSQRHAIDYTVVITSLHRDKKKIAIATKLYVIACLVDDTLCLYDT